jgi:hypothetical protein
MGWLVGPVFVAVWVMQAVSFDPWVTDWTEKAMTCDAMVYAVRVPL